MSIDDALAPSSTTDASVAWRDGKRYLWILGVVVANLPFVAWGPVSLTGLVDFLREPSDA
jgi:hypothetical protein